ncbi:MAG: AMP-binding protein [Planctomycetes bacterium]|nr:AMP-binding protein [Planctomycetota bacterium]
MSETPSFEFGGEIVWRPDQETARRCHLRRFCDRHGLAGFDELMERSARDIRWFTSAVLAHLDIRFEHPYEKVLDMTAGIERPRWCVGGRLNITASCLDRQIGTAVEARHALVWEGEEGVMRTLTYGDLAREVDRCAAALRALGLGKGDAVGLFMPMTPEIVTAFFAVVRIGGIVIPLFSGYGPSAVASRLADAEAKALFTSDGAFRRGKAVALKPIADEALQHCPSVRHVVVLRRTGQNVAWSPGRDHDWHEWLSDAAGPGDPESTEAEDPLMIIYTSGTTGRPKGAVHTHCGFPVKAAQDMAFGTDVQFGDRIYWMTDMGWMMGPWLLFGSTLLCGTMFLYDGAPDAPGPDRVWALVERHGLTHLGIAPTLVRSLMKFGEGPVKAHDLSSLRVLASTGEPWNPASWLWLFRTVGGGRLPIINYSGGTEISGGIVMGNLLRPLKPCAFSGPCPGIAADVVDENGRSVRGQVGELVIRAPWIGMTRGFWKDPARYLETYWSRWPGVWVHGDFAAVDGDGLWYILGRSDDTIKIAGKRLGPAEVESVLVSDPAVLEAAAIGVPDEVKGQALVVVCVLRPGHAASEALAASLRARVATELGKPLQPKAVLFVADLPKTRNAKVMRRVVRAAYLGQDPGDISSLENPMAIEEIRRAALEAQT